MSGFYGSFVVRGLGSGLALDSWVFFKHSACHDHVLAIKMCLQSGANLANIGNFEVKMQPFQKHASCR